MPPNALSSPLIAISAVPHDSTTDGGRAERSDFEFLRTPPPPFRCETGRRPSPRPFVRARPVMNEWHAKRVVVLVDMDCFYCQVEVQHDRSLAGKPVAVVQYNSWRGGGYVPRRVGPLWRRTVGRLTEADAVGFAVENVRVDIVSYARDPNSGHRKAGAEITNYPASTDSVTDVINPYRRKRSSRKNIFSA